MTRDIAKAWKTIENWFERHAPGAFVLHPPATQDQIDAAEDTIGYALPDDYKASLRMHDGMDANEALDWFHAYWLAPIDDCVAAWTDARESDDESADLDDLDEDEKVRSVMSHARRFPIIGTPYWDYNVVLLDHLQGPSGDAGQLVALTSECDYELVAGSFGAFLERLAELMDSDALEAQPDGGIVRIVAKADRRALGELFSEAPPAA